MRTCDALDEAKDALGFSAESPNPADQVIEPELRHVHRALVEIESAAGDGNECAALAEAALAECRRAREYLVCESGSWELESMLIGLEAFFIRRARGVDEDPPKDAAAFS